MENGEDKSRHICVVAHTSSGLVALGGRRLTNSGSWSYHTLNLLKLISESKQIISDCTTDDFEEQPDVFSKERRKQTTANTVLYKLF